jgi:small GTP-binding protein
MILSDYNFTILIVGSQSCGKSSLINRLNNINYCQQQDIASTIGVDFKTKTIEISRSNLIVQLKIYDTSGSFEYRSVVESYFYPIQAFIICYDVTSWSSFLQCKSWLESIELTNDHYKIKRNELIKFLVGCKDDKINIKDKQVDILKKRGKEFSHKHNFCSFIETSAKDNLNVSRLFEELSIEIVLNFRNFLVYHHQLLGSNYSLCTAKSSMINPNTTRNLMSIEAMTSFEDVYFNCETQLLNLSFIFFNQFYRNRKSQNDNFLSIFNSIFFK